MKLFDVILKLIKVLALVSTEDYQQLVADVREWEDSAKSDPTNKAKAMYTKIHSGVALRLVSPFLFYVVLNKMRNMMNPTENDLFE